MSELSSPQSTPTTLRLGDGAPDVPPKSAGDTPPNPVPFVPKLSGSLTGGLLSSAFKRPAPTPTPPPAAPAPEITTPEPPIETPVPDIPSGSHPPPPGPPTRTLPPPSHHTPVDVHLPNGERIIAKRKLPEYLRVLQSPTPTITRNGTSKTCYGVPITQLLNNLEAEKSAPVEIKASILEHQLQPTKLSKSTLWTEKYRAKRFTDLVGDERTHRHVLHWLKRWDEVVFGTKPKNIDPTAPKDRPKILLLHGAPGLGKTTLAHVAARQAGYETVEINASDDRSGGVVMGKIKDILTIQGIKSSGLQRDKKGMIDSRPVCLIIDEIDGATGGGSGGAGEGSFVTALVNLIMQDQRASRSAGTTKPKRKGKKKDTFQLNRPIIAVCNDLYAPALKPLRNLAETVPMRIPPKGLIVERLEDIFAKEGFQTENGAVRKLVDLSLAGTSGGQSGDMRATIVAAQWIATKISQTDKNGKKRLLRAVVEEELGESRGQSDGKRNNKGRLGPANVVNAVFHLEKPPRGKDIPSRAETSFRVQEMSESLGEFDKITMDCFQSYATKTFNDDFYLTKPNLAYEWLHFSDLLSLRGHNELAGYQSQPIVAFHQLFSSLSAPSHTDLNADPNPTSFTGPSADWEAREATKRVSAIVQSVAASHSSIRLSQTFKSTSSVVMEFAPYVNMMVSPNISPVVVQGRDGFGVASVRRDTEKALVERAVNAMDATGVRFEKVKVDMDSGGGGFSAATGWAYRMEPGLDVLGMFPCLMDADGATSKPQPVRYAVRQVLDQEWKKFQIFRDEEARQARMGALTASGKQLAGAKVKKEERRQEGIMKRARGIEGKRDFFGRLVETAEDGDEEEAKVKRRKVVEVGNKQDVWVSFNEGYSNAVKKPVRLSEILDGL